MSMLKNSKLWSSIVLLCALLCLAGVAVSIFGFRAESLSFRTSSAMLVWVFKAAAGTILFSIVVMLLGRKNSGAVKRCLVAVVLAAIPIVGIAINQPPGTTLAALNPPARPVPAAAQPAGAGMGGAGAAMGAAGMAGAPSGRTPPLNDISTDTSNPPLFNAVIPLRDEGSNTVEYPGTVAANTQKQLFPDIEPIKTSLSNADAFTKAVAVLNDMGIEIVAEDTSTGIIEAVASTRFFGFKDDVVVRVTTTNNGSIVDIRSHSRIGRGDRGKNAERVRRFIKDFSS